MVNQLMRSKSKGIIQVQTKMINSFQVLGVLQEKQVQEIRLLITQGEIEEDTVSKINSQVVERMEERIIQEDQIDIITIDKVVKVEALLLLILTIEERLIM